MAGIVAGRVTDAVVTSRLDRRVFLVAGVVFAVLMLVSPWYGFDRDELYFLDCARHLQASYVDQPLFTPLLARVSLALFGVSLPGLRLWPALAASATVLVGATTARELGGGRIAQLVTAVGIATMPVLLGADHLMGPTSFDILAWAVLAFVLIRIGRREERRWWLVAGGVLGIGLENKHSVGLFALALALGLVLSGGAHLMADRWLLAGAVLAAACTVPDLWWQAGHGWATIAMTRQLNAENGGTSNVASFIIGQVIMTSVAFLPVWIAGVRFLWRSKCPADRAIVWAYALLFVLFALTTGSKIYYLAGAYVPLVAAGVAAFEGAWVAEPRRLRRFGVAVAGSTLLALPIVLPVLPPQDIGWTYAINQVPGESIGWPELVRTVRAQWQRLTPAERRHAVIFTADYGEAGAINELGRGSGLPVAVSGHNSEWWWGPGNRRAATVLAVAPGPRDVSGYGAYLKRFFRSVRVVARLSNAARIHNQEWGGHVYLCTGTKSSWGAIWPKLRHYD